MERSIPPPLRVKCGGDRISERLIHIMNDKYVVYTTGMNRSAPSTDGSV